MYNIVYCYLKITKKMLIKLLKTYRNIQKECNFFHLWIKHNVLPLEKGITE